MTRHLTLLLLVLAAAIACDRAPAPAPAATTTATTTTTAPAEQPVSLPRGDTDADNLLNIANGASVVSRTGEFDLEHSALHAIDGMNTTRWSTPPGGGSQSMVFALPAPARIERVGVHTGTRDQVPSRVRFSVSSDATNWREIASFEPRVQAEPQFVSVTPVDTMYLRFETIEPKKQEVSLLSVHALGRELDTPQSQWFNGCWEVNRWPAGFVQNGARIQGVIGGDKPTALDGGTNGRVARFMWLRGPMWGYAALTMAPGGQSLSMLFFHQEALVGSAAAAWFGARCKDRPSEPTPASPLELLERAGRWSMFGLAFLPNDELIEDSSRSTLDAAAAIIRDNPSQRFRVVAHELREKDAASNKARSNAQLEAVRRALRARGVQDARVEYVASGSESTRLESTFAIQRLIGSRIDLEIQR